MSQATISDYIKRDLADRIRSNLELPAGLTLPELSRHYGVSSTPVREAIRDLVAEGVLLKGDNGRVQVNPKKSASAKAKGSAKPRPKAEPERPELPSRSADLEATLTADVIAGSLRGEDGYLREEATAKRLGVGRTAIRQVFGRLAGRGLIEHVPRCGWRVRAFDADDLRAYLEVRETLELKALELARHRLDPDDLRAMLEGNIADQRKPRLENRFHRYLIDKAENPYIREFFDRQGAYYTTLFDFAAPETHVVREMARQHREILQALIDRDWTRARRTLADHIRAQRPIVEDLLQRIGRLPKEPDEIVS
ncbi:GntR family transcriptional regulator [Singulisphaera sp. PoT]|uniref:GntR family transcriptional regulator n=1 Tax=Singulisphaera sp. PoT TaxID=3411797 RepID=UPI003BF5D007